MRVLVFVTRNGTIYMTEYGQVVLRHGLLTVSKFFPIEEAQRFFAERESGKNSIKMRAGNLYFRLENGGLRLSSGDFDWLGQIEAEHLHTLDAPAPF